MKTTINLLPLSYRKQTLMRRRAIQWGTVLCVVLSAIWTARWCRVHERVALSQQLEAVAREGRPAQAMLQEITDMRQQIKQLKHHEAVAKELEAQRHALSLFGLVSQAARSSSGRLRVTEFQAVDLQSTHSAAMNNQLASRAGTVTLVGVSLDGPTVANFHDVLLKSGLFADVKLIKSNERDENGVALSDYEVSCEL